MDLLHLENISVFLCDIFFFFYLMHRSSFR